MMNDNEQNYRSVDPSDDETTNLKDDGSTEERAIEADHLDEGERPDIHTGAVPGQVDPRMAEAAAQIESEHQEADMSETGREANLRDPLRSPNGGTEQP
ncbi:hypothetical protein [Saccharibacillus alkalitolerans]|uniref:DUF4025 domain-containing protein n=1 Tax=Saccharibacillus alkalitolerans TaxID=2705290 RepID=A0ABX0F9S2_9BACL|nr:hypothetical protein [Saccharibacillus alkalitolerans]NGZ75971.1 hypothetical protein [Saccharibacillus alkalitolerans]